MKFSISINQKSAIESGLPLDVVDLIIVDYSKWWILSRKSEKIVVEEKEYTWVDYGHLLGQLPILGITTKDAVSRRFAKLVDCQILEKHFDKKSNRAFFRFGSNYDLLEWDGEGTDSKSDGTDQKSEGYGLKVGRGTVGKSDNNNTTILIIDTFLNKSQEQFPLLTEKIREFVQHRKEIKHKFTETSFKSFIKKLERLSGGDETLAVEILDNSISNGWQGIFEIKGRSPNSNFNSFTQKVGVATL